MEKSITLKELYIELEKDPDLRRLGRYKLIPNEGKPISPIDIDLDGRDINLGEGDFTESFTAFGNTKAHSLDLDNCKFTDLYLDSLHVGSLNLSKSIASRLFFDSAKINDCRFESFVSPEVYFDTTDIENVFIQDLKSKIIYPAKSKIKNVDYDGELSKSFRFALDSDGTKSFGNFSISETQENLHESEEEITLSPDQFIDELKKDSDLRRLGKYKVSPASEGESLNIDGTGIKGKINFGHGDFSLLSSVSFSGENQEVELEGSKFAELKLGGSKIVKLDLGQSQIGWLNFDSSEIKDCFFSDFYGFKISGGNAKILNIFCERGNVKDFYFDTLEVEQININQMVTEELRLGKSKIRELFMSNGKNVQKLYCEESRLWLLNLHEATLEELDFGESIITKALINKCTIKEVQCGELVSELLYVGNDGRNELGLVDFAEGKGIKHIEIEKILPKKDEATKEQRHVFETLRFR